jgi:hypothetical protein
MNRSGQSHISFFAALMWAYETSTELQFRTWIQEKTAKTATKHLHPNLAYEQEDPREHEHKEEVYINPTISFLQTASYMIYN